MLVVLLAIEGATIPLIHQLLSVHVFVGMLLVGPIVLKLASTGYRFGRYYTGSGDYVRLGPPAMLMRVVVAPVLVVSTITLFGTGIALLVDPRRGGVLLLHKASFIVWFAAMSIHVLSYLGRLAGNVAADLTSRRVRGRGVRVAAVTLAFAAGLVTAVATYSLADPWFHGVVR